MNCPNCTEDWNGEGVCPDCHTDSEMASLLPKFYLMTRVWAVGQRVYEDDIRRHLDGHTLIEVKKVRETHVPGWWDVFCEVGGGARQ